MATSVIEVSGLAKRYRLGEDFGRYLSLRDSLASWVKRRGRASRAADPDIWALRNVNFVVGQGEVVGVVGVNGAGKTTLLKAIARIIEPTKGVSRTRGKVGALLDVGTGFHPELTGRENVYLNGAVLGMRRRDVQHRFDEIVDFAGVEQFLDTPLKRYSSGMSLRLAFAVAAHVEPPIVVVDEILAVGDAQFQQKCLGKMSDLQREGRTVMFVSHDLGAVQKLCPRSLWIDRGEVLADGPTPEVVSQYLKVGLPQSSLIPFAPTAGGGVVDVASMVVGDATGAPVEMPRRHEPLTVTTRFRTRVRLPDLNLAVYLLNHEGVRVIDESWSDTGAKIHDPGPGEYTLSVTIPPVLSAGEYVLGLWVGSTTGGVSETFFHRELITLRLSPSPEDRPDARRRILRASLDWSVERVD